MKEQGITFKFHVDEDGELHCWNRHMIDADDVVQAFFNYDEESETGGALSRHGYTESGLYLRVVFKWNKPSREVFIITACPI